MADDDKKKNMLVLGVCSVLLVAMVVALTIGTGRYDSTTKREVSSSEKAIQSICQPTSYQAACVESLESSSAANATDPKELIQASIHVTITRLRDAMKNATLFKEVRKDPRSKQAMENCEVLAERAVDDLNRTLDKFSEFDLSDLDNWLSDLKTWLSGSLTYQQTCLDGFQEIPGDYQEKMKKLLINSMQLTSNALAMVTEISSVLSNLGVEGVSSASKRRLLADDLRAPDWVEDERRELLTARRWEIKPNLTVAKDGSGQYRTINEALKDIPRNKNDTFVLYIKEGVYDEQVTFFRNMTHLMVMGDGPSKTKITGSLNFIDGVGTYHTATVAALGDFFMARDIGFENSAGAAKHQAVALRVGADKSIFYNCQMDGYQDTLYVHTYRQFYRNCVISGTIDFIFGNSAAMFQNCTLVIRKPMENQQCIVTAQGRIDPRQPTGLVLQNCSFVADAEYHPLRFTLKSYLGRPWKEFSRTVIMESDIGDFIQQDGWLPWNGDFALNTLFYTEYNNRGPASDKENRVKWAGVKELPLNRIERFTASRFIQGDSWIKSTALPYNSGFIFPPPKPKPAVKYSPVVPDEIKDLGAQEKAAYNPPKPSPPPDQTSTAKPPPPPPESIPFQGDALTTPASITIAPSPVEAFGPSSASSISAPVSGPVQADAALTPTSSQAAAPGPAQPSNQMLIASVSAPAPIQGSISPSSPTSPALFQESAQSSAPSVSAPPSQTSTPASSPTASSPTKAATLVPTAAPTQNSATQAPDSNGFQVSVAQVPQAPTTFAGNFAVQFPQSSAPNENVPVAAPSENVPIAAPSENSIAAPTQTTLAPSA